MDNGRGTSLLFAVILYIIAFTTSFLAIILKYPMYKRDEAGERSVGMVIAHLTDSTICQCVLV